MVKPTLLCPVYKVPLKLIPWDQATKNGVPHCALPNVTGYLINEARGVLYPVVEGIPQLVRWQALEGIADQLKGEPFIHSIRQEIAIYDALVGSSIDVAVANLIPSFQRLAKYQDRFPAPLNIWVDCVPSSDTQWKAYQHLAPLSEVTFLQFGGKGTHAVKALLAGAAQAYLLSPSHNEIKFGRQLAHRLGVAERFNGIRGIGEEIPLEDESCDRIYGGGCLHHTDISKALPEIHRILTKDGKAAFVEPKYNQLYSLLLYLTGNRRFLGQEDDVRDQPIDLAQLHAALDGIPATIYLSGGIFRYLVTAITRILKRDVLKATLSYNIFRWERQLMLSLGLSSLFNQTAILLGKSPHR